MKLINPSSILLGVVALSSMADRADAQMPSIQDVLAMINADQVQGTNQPEENPRASSIVAETAPAEEEAPEIENFSATTNEPDIKADVIDVQPADPVPAPSAAPSAPPKPITCIDRSLEVCCLYRSFSLVIHLLALADFSISFHLSNMKQIAFIHQCSPLFQMSMRVFAPFT